MKRAHMHCVARILGFVATLLLACSSYGQTCTGKFANPITDICWSCILPISIGAARVATLGQEDIENPASPLCVCPGFPIRLGVSIGFWEPARQEIGRASCRERG